MLCAVECLPCFGIGCFCGGRPCLQRHHPDPRPMHGPLLCSLLRSSDGRQATVAVCGSAHDPPCSVADPPGEREWRHPHACVRAAANVCIACVRERGGCLGGRALFDNSAPTGGGGGRGGTGHLGLTETQRGRLWTACGQRCVDSKNSQTTPATTSTSSIHQLLGAADAQTAHPAAFSTGPTHQLLGSANAETTPARAPAAAADRKQRPDATCEGKNG